MKKVKIILIQKHSVAVTYNSEESTITSVITIDGLPPSKDPELSEFVVKNLNNILEAVKEDIKESNGISM